MKIIATQETKGAHNFISIVVRASDFQCYGRLWLNSTSNTNSNDATWLIARFKAERTKKNWTNERTNFPHWPMQTQVSILIVFRSLNLLEATKNRFAHKCWEIYVKIVFVFHATRCILRYKNDVDGTQKKKQIHESHRKSVIIALSYWLQHRKKNSRSCSTPCGLCLEYGFYVYRFVA